MLPSVDAPIVLTCSYDFNFLMHSVQLGSGCNFSTCGAVELICMPCYSFELRR